jgi:hypothetical protein
MRKKCFPGYVSEAEAARLLDLKPITLRTWRRQGKGPPFTKYARRVFYAADSISAWLQSLERKPVRAA